MKKLNKKGFTIIELVIVIAVIAILAAVLIPTFTVVVRKANESAASQASASVYKEVLALDIADGEQDGKIGSAGITLDDLKDGADETDKAGVTALYYDGKDFVTFDGKYFVQRNSETGKFTVAKAGGSKEVPTLPDSITGVTYSEGKFTKVGA